MEVIDSNLSVLSNFEVLTLLKDIQAGQNDQSKPNRNQQNLATITYEASKYLEKTPCQYQTSEIVQKFMLALTPFKLTKAEKLQLLNNRPTTAVEIQLLIEESEERLTEEQIDGLLEVINSTLPDQEGAAPSASGSDESMIDAAA